MDVSVRGAGIFGLSVAWACVQAGATVELVDPNGLGAGSSGGVVGALAPHVPENWNPKKQFQLESLLLAEGFWAEVSEVSTRDPGYTRAGRIQPLADPAGLQLAQQRGENAKSLWQARATWEVTADARGWELETDAAHFIFDTLSAHIHPRKACAALAEALARKGVDLKSHADASAGSTIWATGATGLDDISAETARQVGQGIKGQAALLGVNCAGLPQLFVDTLHIIPHLDGTVAIGSTTEREFDDPTATDHQLDKLIERAQAVVPALRNAPVIERWAGLRPRARSRAPMLGAWPNRSGHFIANGGFKIGFGMAPKIGTVMADLVLHNVDAIPEGFDVPASM